MQTAENSIAHAQYKTCKISVLNFSKSAGMYPRELRNVN